MLTHTHTEATALSSPLPSGGQLQGRWKIRKDDFPFDFCLHYIWCPEMCLCLLLYTIKQVHLAASFRRSFDLRVMWCWVPHLLCGGRSAAKWLDVICGICGASLCSAWLRQTPLTSADSWTPKTPPDSKTKVICKLQGAVLQVSCTQ